jgi:hypothetical protein
MGLVGDTITISGRQFGTSGSISFNGVSGSPTSWGDTSVVTTIPAGAQTGPVTVTVNGQTSNGVTLTVVSVPNLTGVTPNTGDVGTLVTITGTGFGVVQSYNAVVFNGLAVEPTSWTNTQITVTVPRGATTGPVAVRIGHILSNASTFTIVPAGSQAVSIIPGSATLVVGQTLNLKLSDDLEHDISGATWTLSDNTLADLSQDNPPVLTANNVGTVTVTASWQNLSANAQITILDARSAIPLGTVQWSLPASTSVYSVQKIMQAVPGDGTTPDLLVLEDDNQGGMWLRGLQADGQQKWHTRVGSSSPSGPDFVWAAVPDDSGGAVALVAASDALSSLEADSLVRQSGESGAQTWRYDSAGRLGALDERSMAVDQNGRVFVIETMPDFAFARVTSIDPASGAPVATWDLPHGFSAYSESCGDSSYSISSDTSPDSEGPISIGPDAAAYVEVLTSIHILHYDCNTEIVEVSDSYSLELVRIPPGGSPTQTVLASGIDGPASPGEVIPDSNGGALAAWRVNGSEARVTHVGGGQASLPLGDQPRMVLGDQSSYFTTDGTQVVAVNEADDNQKWAWQPSQGGVEIIAATAGGGVAVRNILDYATENVVRLDADGNPTYDTWGTNGSGYGVLSNASYFGNGLWVGLTGNPVVGGVVGSDLYTALSHWTSPKGTKQEQAAADPALKLVGLEDCTQKSPAGSGQFSYERFPKYKLVDKNEQSPTENYTVFEKLDPHKEFTICQRDGKNTGMSPCGYADGNTIPYREFDDDITLRLSNAGPNGIHNNQSFFYGLPSKRLWEVKRIERYGRKADNSGYGQVAVEHSYLDLWLRNFAEPLIDGMGAPWVGPCNGEYPLIPVH